MTPIEDRLNAYLDQFEEAMLPISLRRGLYLDRQLAHSGIVPVNPIQLPANTTPKLLNNLLTEGDNPMNNQSKPKRVRIYSHITQSRFLHIEDSLSLGQGKLRLFGGTYRKNEGMGAYSNAFVDIADARVIFGALARGEQNFRHKEYKGTPPQNGNKAVSRVLSIAVKGENVYIELKTGPGKLTNTGAITPNGKATVEVNVSFKLYEARRMAAEVLAYIHAWDVMRMMVHQQLVSQPDPYLLVSTTSEANTTQTMPANGVSKQNGVTKPAVTASQNGRPVTRKAAKPTIAANGSAKKNGNGTQPQRLLYGDGTPVAADNLTECNTYVRYRQAKGVIPPSKSVLQQFYQQQAVN